MGIKPCQKELLIQPENQIDANVDNKSTPKNTPSLKPHKHKKGD